MGLVWDIIVLVIFIAVPLGGSFVIAFTTGGPDAWYNDLEKPWWTPPGWVFPVIWTPLYILMGVAAWLVWRQGGFERQWLALLVFAIQLLLNFAWTPLFFSMHRPDVSLADIVLLWLAILGTIILFWPVNKWAALALVPYIIWVSIATSLNGYIFIHNPHLRFGPREDLSGPLIGGGR
eukprot:TRINITY_DN26407_c0_g1_i1.p1 TRINITY_DN26407_c0_g1~~TRINITY_DN26407_c0_g1_i1.p1  ORF type:complete len:178 (-),score=31.30 TRINITY_DN26407_c0_g1_i1:730-1263(-)